MRPDDNHSRTASAPRTWAGPVRGLAADTLLHNRFAPLLASTISRLVPLRLLRPAAAAVARRLSQHLPAPIRQAARANQAVVRGVAADDPALDQAVADLFANVVVGLADLYAAANRGTKGVTAACHVDAAVRERCEACLLPGRGLVLVGLHMVGFELALLRLGLLRHDTQVLSHARPRHSHRSENAVRRRFGLHTTPISRASVAEADARLEGNGIVVTGIDVPTRHGTPLPFFGRTTKMPTLHAELAIRHGSPTALVVPTRGHDHRYSITLVHLRHGRTATSVRSSPIDLAMELVAAAERHISSRPAEWRVLQPVWPDLVVE